MSKITRKGKMTEKDVKDIATMCEAGINVKAVSEITGWSAAVCYKIKNGTYYEQKQKAREAWRKKAHNQNLQPPPTEPETPTMNLSEQLLAAIDLKLKKILEALGVN